MCLTASSFCVLGVVLVGARCQCCRCCLWFLHWVPAVVCLGLLGVNCAFRRVPDWF